MSNIKERASLAILALVILSIPSFVFAQVGNSFGRNKVQYRDFDWSTLRTEHFDIYYYTEERSLAHRAARMAERSYAMLSDVLDHEIEARIPLILYASHNDFQQTNAVGGLIPEGVEGITESLKHRVILPFTGSYADFNHVLTHELVHAFQFDVMSSMERGKNPIQKAIPLWFTEGMAEYLSVGMDDGTEVWIRDALKNDKLVSVSKLNQLVDIRVYRFGQALWYYIAETYGEDKIGVILQKSYYYGDAEKALTEVLGLKEKELTDGWHRWISENFRLSQSGCEPDEIARRLTHHTGYWYNLNVMPAVSPQGDKVVYLSNRNLYNDIFLQDLDGDGKGRVIVHGGRSGSFESLRFLDTQLSWSFDGKYIAMVGERKGRDAVYIMDAENGDIVRRFSPGMDGIISPAWSPDGKRIVFTGIREGQSDLYVINVDGTGLRQLTDDIYSDLQPRWSPDGEFIAFATDRGEETDVGRLLFGHLEVALYDLSSGLVRVLTKGAEDCHNPVWSPDGSSIAFISSMGGAPNIFSIDILGDGRLKRITDLAMGVGGITPTSPAISWSREGGSIAFSAFSRGGWDLFILDNAEGDTLPEEMETEEEWSHPDYGAYALPDSGEATEEEYQARFAPDILVGGVGYSNNVGVAGQSYLQISDMLGNRNFLISTDIYGSLSRSNLLFSYINLAHRTNYALTGFQYRNDFGLFTAPDSAEFISQIYRGGGIILSRPFDVFTRVEYGAYAIFLQEDVFSQSFVTQQVTVDSSAVNFFVNPMAAVVQDNAIFGSTGPIAGHRYRLQVESGLGQIRFTTLTGDYRRYFNLARRYTLAYWLVGAGSFGENAQIFRIGGPYTFRGADYGGLAGTRVVLQDIELRFPVLFWLPPTYDFLKGAIFWDMAGAWEKAFQPFTTRGSGFVRLRDLQGAYGAGVRLGLGYFILRFDAARRTDLVGSVGRFREFLSVGGDY